MIKECQVKVKLSIISIPSQAVALPETSFFPPCFVLFWTWKSQTYSNLKHIWDSIQSSASGAKILLSSTSLLDGSRWGQFQQWILKAGIWCFSSSHQGIQKFWSLLKLDKLWFEFKWIDFCNLLGRVCKHSLLKSSSNTPRKWNDYITSAGPLVGNRCWIQPAGRAKACETNGSHHSCLSDVFFWETSRQIGLHYPDLQVILWECGGQSQSRCNHPVQFFRWTHALA